LIFRFPEGEHAGTVIDEMVRSLDILPTALDYAEVAVGQPMEGRMIGTSLLPLADGDETAKTIDRAVTEKRVRDTDALRLAFRTELWKYVYDGKTEEIELYDLQADPEEAIDVSDDETDIAEKFRRNLSERVDRIRETSTDVDVPALDVEAGVEERLRALGYRD
jgi:arylsulfatase A-like enzyme